MKQRLLIKTFFFIFSVFCFFISCTKETEPNKTPTTTKGTGTFWMASNFGTITVRCNGETSSVYNVYSSTPDCGAAGCANFDLPKGTYSFSASNTTGTVWSGSITINPGFCALMQLN